jgi:predicted HD phosphohydrolase
MALYHAIGDFVEDFIEQAHQIGRTEDTQTRNMRDRRLAALSNSKWEWIALHADAIGSMRVKKKKHQEKETERAF